LVVHSDTRPFLVFFLQERGFIAKVLHKANGDKHCSMKNAPADALLLSELASWMQPSLAFPSRDCATPELDDDPMHQI
jgi:hypothetical protein